MSDGSFAADWIAVDWGTTNLRAWAMAGDRPLASLAAPLGMGTLARDAFEPALLGAIEDWLEAGKTIPVVACGMVGARQGWQEAPYAPVPCAPLVAAAMRRVATADPRVSVAIVHGLSQEEPADVMRGEETQIAGLLALEKGFEGAVCLPGTHTKWAAVEAGEVQRFRTFMTGELFGLVSAQSILRHSLAEGAETDERAFADALAEIAADPAGLAASLFSTRAAGLLRGMTPAQARGRISGLLIGLEIAAMRRELGRGVTLLGETGLARRYAGALALLGLEDVRMADPTACTLAGLAAAKDLVEG